MTEPFQPLREITVLDWTEGAAGPNCCQILADLGANVIKIERPQGDWGRGAGHGSNLGGHHFVALNRNKRNLSIDLRKPESLDVVWRLLKQADVMVTSYRPGVMERLGLGYEQVHAKEPSVIYARVSAYGYSGPMAERPGSDTILQAVSALMNQIGGPDDDPQRVGVPVVDFLAGRDLVIGILLALGVRGSGQPVPGPVDASLFASASTFQTQIWQQYFIDGTIQARAGQRHPSLYPAGLFLTRDGRHIAVAILRNEHYVKFCEAIGRPELVTDERFTTNADRLINRDALEAIIVPLFASRDFDEWTSILLENDVLAGPVMKISDIDADENLRSALPIVKIPDGPLGPSSEAIGTSTMFGTPLRDEASSIAPARRGQHTREVLREAGFAEDEIDELVHSGVTPEG